MSNKELIMKRQVLDYDNHSSIDGMSIGELITYFQNIKLDYPNDARLSIMTDFDFGTTDIRIEYTREETDAEYTRRLADEAKLKVKYEAMAVKQKLKTEQNELKLLAKLKKKYPQA